MAAALPAPPATPQLSPRLTPVSLSLSPAQGRSTLPGPLRPKSLCGPQLAHLPSKKSPAEIPLIHSPSPVLVSQLHLPPGAAWPERTLLEAGGAAFSSDTAFPEPCMLQSSSNTSRLGRAGGGCQCESSKRSEGESNPDGRSLTGGKGAAKASREQTGVGGGGDIGDTGRRTTWPRPGRDPAPAV